MTVIRNNSISGINSITAQSGALNFYDSTGNTLSIGASVSGNITGDVTGNLTGNVTVATGATISGSTNTITASTNGSERVRIASDGDVFIGNSNLGTNVGSFSKLEVTGTLDNTYPQYSFPLMVNDDAAYNSSGGPGGGIGFAFKQTSGGAWAQAGGIRGVKENTTDGNYASALIFYTRPNGSGVTEAARFNSSGNLAFPSGQGIDFSANSNAAGMTSELLDDYEEGTFTPTFTAGTVSGGYTRQVGEYTKVGRLVTFTLTIDGDGNLQGAAQAIEIGGLPFTSRHAPELGGAIITYPGNFDTTNNRRFWLVAQNNTTLSYRDSSSQNINGNAVTNVNSQLNLCGQYFTDS